MLQNHRRLVRVPLAKRTSSSRRRTSLPGPLHLVRGAFSTNRAWLLMRTAHSEPIIVEIDSDLIHWPTRDIGETGGHWSQITEKRADAPWYRGSRIRLQDIMCLRLLSMTPTIPIPEIRIGMWTRRRCRILCFIPKL